MRPKVILFALALALGILLPALYFHFKPDNPPEAPVAAADTAAPAALPTILKRVSPKREGLPPRSSAPVAGGSLTGNAHDDYVLERKAQLVDLGMSDNPDNLKALLSEMENPDPEIRKQALRSIIDFGSPDAIPALENEMAYATDPQEKIDIKNAIDFLKLPSFGSQGGATAKR
jgi:HEAT repeat protein